MTLDQLMTALREGEIAVSYDGQNVRLRPPFEDLLTGELREAMTKFKPALVWLCCRRLRPNWHRPPWEFWFGSLDDWYEFGALKLKFKGEGVRSDGTVRV